MSVMLSDNSTVVQLQCPRCTRKGLTAEDFPPNRSSCRHCKAWEQAYRNRPERQHAKLHDVARRYGLTNSEYLALFDRQSNVCAVCGKPESKTRRNGTPIRLAVDHDHATGKVRGLLCTVCNILVGNLEQVTPEVVDLAYTYIHNNGE